MVKSALVLGKNGDRTIRGATIRFSGASLIKLEEVLQMKTRSVLPEVILLIGLLLPAVTNTAPAASGWVRGLPSAT